MALDVSNTSKINFGKFEPNVLGDPVGPSYQLRWCYAKKPKLL